MAHFTLPLIVFAILVGTFPHSRTVAASEIGSFVQQRDEAFVQCCKEAKLGEDVVTEAPDFEAFFCNYSTFLMMPDERIGNEELGPEALLTKAENGLVGKVSGANNTDPCGYVRMYYDCMLGNGTEYELCGLNRGMDKSDGIQYIALVQKAPDYHRDHKCFGLVDSKIATLAGHCLITYKNVFEDIDKIPLKYRLPAELKTLRTQMNGCNETYGGKFEFGDYIQVAIGCWRDVGRLGFVGETCNAPPGSEL